VSVLRPETTTGAPEVVSALRDYEWMAPAMVAFMGSGMLLAWAAVSLRYRALWPRALGWLAIVAAIAYSLRTGALFTVDGVFAADGVFGFLVPVIAIATWVTAASATLTLRLRREQRLRRT
jgi:hypothetical protein